MLFLSILLFLPFFLLCVCMCLPARHGNLATISNKWVLFFTFLFVISIAFFPEELSVDKFRYTRMYFQTLIYGNSIEFRDIGWVGYNSLCGWIFGRNYEWFYLLTSLIYVFGFYFFAYRYFPKRYIGYFLLMSVGCLGFSSYGTNVIRAGIAISLLLFASSLKLKKYIRIGITILIVMISLSFHKSMIIPIVAFMFAKFFDKIWVPLLIWAICLVLSMSNFDMGPLFESVGFIDERVESYANSIDDIGSNYNKGFRFDFLIYSVVPLIFAFYYILQKNISDSTYTQCVRMYLLANGIWLLAIRMAYSDRLAYLSWFLIPFITLYPVINYRKAFRGPKTVVFSVMYIFMGLKILLSMRQYL